MGGFAFQVTCLRLVANEPLFRIHAVPVDWPVLIQNLRIVEVLSNRLHILEVSLTKR